MKSMVNVPGKLDKKKQRKEGKNFAGVDDYVISDIGCKIASSITARYYKGISADGDNLVIVKVK